jgi:magnesium transporter
MAETKDVSIIVSTLLTLLEEKKYPTIKEILMTMNPADIAAAFEEMEENRLPVLFRLIPKEAAAETFVEMEPDLQELLIRGFSDNELKVLYACRYPLKTVLSRS